MKIFFKKKMTGKLTTTTNTTKATLTSRMQTYDKAGKPIGKPVIKKQPMRREPISAKEFNTDRKRKK